MLLNIRATLASLPENPSNIIPLRAVLPKSSKKMTIPDEYDIIVCGGGSAGCVVAGRSILTNSPASTSLWC